MVRRESSIPLETERSDSKEDGGTEKTEPEKKQQIHLQWMRLNQLKQKQHSLTNTKKTSK